MHLLNLSLNVDGFDFSFFLKPPNVLQCDSISLVKVMFTTETEAAMEELEGGNEEAVKSFLEICQQRLESLVVLVQGNLAPQDRAKVYRVGVY